MTKELVEKYARLLNEFNLEDTFERSERGGLLSFLSKPNLTESKLAELVRDLMIRTETKGNGYLTKRTDRWVVYIEDFESGGTIRANFSDSTKRRLKEIRREVTLNNLKKYPDLYKWAVEYSKQY